MAGPFSYTGWGTSSIAPAPTAAPAVAPAAMQSQTSVGGPQGTAKPGTIASVMKKYTPTSKKQVANVRAEPTADVAPAPVATTSVQTGGNAVAPGSFSFTGWSSSTLVPKVASAPIVQGQAGSIPANAIPVGQGGPATGNNVGGSGIPSAITDAESTLSTFSNPSLLGFFQNLLNNQKGGGGPAVIGGGLSPTQEALNKQRLDLIGEPTALAKQLRDVEARKAAAGPAAFGMYEGSEQQRIDNQRIDLMTRLGPATTAATAAGGLAKPYSSISAPDANGIRRNANGWAVSNWI